MNTLNIVHCVRSGIRSGIKKTNKTETSILNYLFVLIQITFFSLSEQKTFSPSQCLIRNCLQNA